MFELKAVRLKKLRGVSTMGSAILNKIDTRPPAGGLMFYDLLCC